MLYDEICFNFVVTSGDLYNVTTENNIVETVAIEEVDDTYFTTSKLERENMYSQMLETYQQIYNNAETDFAVLDNKVVPGKVFSWNINNEEAVS